MNTEMFKIILSAKPSCIEPELIDKILDEELDKGEMEMDTELVDLCLDALDSMPKYHKVAIIGSRSITLNNLEEYIPVGTEEIVSGGAKGVDSCAEKYALEHNLKFTKILPEYEKYGRSAPLKRNDLIIDYADMVIAFWDGKSRGTKYVIDHCKKKKKPLKVYAIKNNKKDSR